MPPHKRQPNQTDNRVQYQNWRSHPISIPNPARSIHQYRTQHIRRRNKTLRRRNREPNILPQHNRQKERKAVRDGCDAEEDQRKPPDLIVQRWTEEFAQCEGLGSHIGTVTVELVDYVVAF